MAESDFRAKIVALAPSAQALAAIGAALQLRRDGATAPAEVQGLLDNAIKQLGLPAPRDLDAPEIDRLVAMVNFHLRHALELFTNPGGSQDGATPIWTCSRRRAPCRVGSSPRSQPRRRQGLELAAVLDHPGAFLDVDTGVGRLAIEAARTWPALHVVGIDIWEPALTAARRNVADARLEDRVELRSQNVLQLPDRASFTLAWVPVPFFQVEALAALLPRARDALVPGGWIVCGMESLPDEPVARTLSMLRTIRGGGTIISAEDVARCLRVAGFAAWRPYHQVSCTSRLASGQKFDRVEKSISPSPPAAPARSISGMQCRE